jgi:ABC-2 type transport system ATP-binding protein
MLQVKGLTKSFGNKRILDDINFGIAKHEIVGLVGPNGSGKTTLLNILIGMFQPTSGTFQYDEGITVGMAVSRKGFFADMTVTSNLMTFADLKNVDRGRVDALLKEFNIDFGEQRVSLVFAFIFDSDLVFLDEPSNHLDIDSLIAIKSKILRERSLGKSFLVTSHILTDLEQICDRILFLKNGHLVMNRKKEDILSEFSSLEDAYLNLK